MDKKGKIILVAFIILLVSITGITISVGKENKIKQSKLEIEELADNEEYSKVIDLFYDVKKMENDFGLTQNECFAVIDYFEALQAYKNKDYETTYDRLRTLNTKNTWIFKNDAEKFKSKFLNSEKGKAIAKRIMEEEKRYEESRKLRDKINKWREENISKIGPYIGMLELDINNTMLGEYNEEKLAGLDYTNETDKYEKRYTWKDDNGREICRVVVQNIEDGGYAYVVDVEYLGDKWEKKSLYNGADDEFKNEFTIGIYKGKLYKDRNSGSDYIENKSDEDMVEEYEDEYDVYEYSDADEFYYDHKDDFEGYEDAEQYYEDAWSFVD